MNPCVSKQGIPLQVPCACKNCNQGPLVLLLYTPPAHSVCVGYIITHVGTPGLCLALLNVLCKSWGKKDTAETGAQAWEQRGSLGLSQCFQQERQTCCWANDRPRICLKHRKPLLTAELTVGGGKEMRRGQEDGDGTQMQRLQLSLTLWGVGEEDQRSTQNTPKRSGM